MNSEATAAMQLVWEAHPYARSTPTVFGPDGKSLAGPQSWAVIEWDGEEWVWLGSGPTRDAAWLDAAGKLADGWRDPEEGES